MSSEDSSTSSPDGMLGNLERQKETITSSQIQLFNAINDSDNRYQKISSQLSAVLKRVASKNEISLNSNDGNADTLSEDLEKVLQAEDLTINADDLSSLQQLATHVQGIEEEKKTNHSNWMKLQEQVTSYNMDLQDLKQYIKIDNLLFHNFPRPPKHFSRISYLKWVAHTINSMLPMLEEPLHWCHITHVFKTKRNLSHVIIVRFNHRGMRDDIFDNKRHLKDHNVSLTEHLTDMNINLLNAARDIVGFKNAWTKNCRVFCLIGNKKMPVSTISNLEVLFADAKEHPDKYTDSRPARKPQYDRFVPYQPQPNNMNSVQNYSQNLNADFPPVPANTNAGNDYSSHFLPGEQHYLNNRNSFAHPRGNYNRRGGNNGRGRGRGK